jgi:hypothetical protein
VAEAQAVVANAEVSAMGNKYKRQNVFHTTHHHTPRQIATRRRAEGFRLSAAEVADVIGEGDVSVTASLPMLEASSGC